MDGSPGVPRAIHWLRLPPGYELHRLRHDPLKLEATDSEDISPTAIQMSIFEFFFKYKPIVYEKGHLAFQLLGSPWLYVPFVVIAGAGAFYAYRNVASDKRRPGLITLRGGTFAILLFIFLRPVLNISTVLPQESYLAVVVDNSESMNIRDDGKETRAELLQKQFENTNFFKKLSDKFRIRTY